MENTSSPRLWIALACAIVALPLGTTVLGGCVGEIGPGDSTVQVARLTLSADENGGLQAQACRDRYGNDTCARYPNPLECDELVVAVMGDASTHGACKAGAAAVDATRLATVREGLPFACRVRNDGACVQCIDLYNTVVVDDCGETELFRAQASALGMQTTEDIAVPVGSGTDDVKQQPATPTPSGSGNPACDLAGAANLYAAQFNELLRREGLKFSYQPHGAAAGSFFGGGDFFDRPEAICDGALLGTPGKRMNECDSNMPGRCYCEDMFLVGGTCRCGRMTAKALNLACGAIPADCDRAQWAVALWNENGAATRWLNGAEGGWGNLPIGKKPLDQAAQPGDLFCKGSPLVLDLDNDGIELTSPREGVRFDLTGRGTPMRAAWIAGSDDALLAMDLDGNGTIDSGAELFGEASRVGGLAADGFAALATLDDPRRGGNGNGIVEPDDLLFSELRLWHDADRDGRSQPDELRDLASAGVRALPVQPTARDRVLDEHGNDLSLRGSYVRADGSAGLLVDVYFITR